MPRKRATLKQQKAEVCNLANDQPRTQKPSEAVQNAGQAVIARIQKCFDLRDHPNTGEAEVNAALRMANRIMKQYGIQENELMLEESETERRQRGGMSTVNIWPPNKVGSAVTQGWVSWLVGAIKIVFACNTFSTAYDMEIMWTFYGIAKHTVAAALAFEAVHNQILDWSGQFKGVSTRNSYCLGIADGLLTLAEKERSRTEEEAREYEARALAARITEEDMKQQVELYRLRNLPTEPTPEAEPEDGMDLDETDTLGDLGDSGDTADVSDNEMAPDYSERHGAEPVIVNTEADFDAELSKFMGANRTASIDKPGLPSREEFLDEDVALPSAEAAGEAIEVEETAEWKSMRQLSTWREMSKDIENSVLDEHKIKLKKGKKTKRSVKDKEAFKKGRKDSEMVKMRAARIEPGEVGVVDVSQGTDSAMVVDG